MTIQDPVSTPMNAPHPSPRARESWSPLAIVLGLSAAFFAIFLAVSGGMYMMRSPGAKSGGGGKTSLFGSGDVAVLELSGVITDSKKTIQKLKRFEEDGDIKAIVLRINSPGGAVSPSQEIYQAVRKSKKPVIASMDSVAASGGYYIACAAKKIYANPGTITGSIGVIMEFVNLSKLYDWAKIHRYSIKTGKFKDAGAEYREMNPEEKALFQAMVDDVLSQFKQAVSTGRSIPLKEVDAIADGRIFSGNQAKKVKLVDELGTLDDAVAEAGKLGGIKGKPGVVYPEKHRQRILDLFLDRDRGDDDAESSETRAGVVGELAGLITGKAPADLSILSPGIYWLWTGR